VSTLYVIRHAQASMFAADYDRLSERGREQARTLGRVLAARAADGHMPFDAVFCGPAQRHLDTAELAREGFAALELACPTPVVLPGFDEHDGQGLVMAALASCTRAAERGSEPAGEVRQLLALAVEAADVTLEPRRRSKIWQVLFEAVMRRWIRAELELDGVESFVAFDRRVRDAFAELRERGRGEVAVFTSVGPTAIVLAQVLGLPAERAFEQAWRLYNTSITRVIYSGDRMTLDGFNEVAHLSPAAHTHR
jgi:broad specificity phosphatase PhoE